MCKSFLHGFREKKLYPQAASILQHRHMSYRTNARPWYYVVGYILHPTRRQWRLANLCDLKAAWLWRRVTVAVCGPAGG